jgi:hypothetical protein
VKSVSEFKRVTLPVTVKVAPKETIKPDETDEVLSKVIEATPFGGVEFTVTTSPGLIITGSNNPGTPDGLQVPAVFQSVLPVLVLVVWALTKFPNKQTNKTIKKQRMVLDGFTDTAVFLGVLKSDLSIVVFSFLNAGRGNPSSK